MSEFQSKAQDLLAQKATYESLDLAGQIARVEAMLRDRETVRPHELGILLALKLAHEIRQGKAPGTESGPLVAAWANEHPASTVDEAVAYARELLLKPSEMAQKIGERLFANAEAPEETDE